MKLVEAFRWMAYVANTAAWALGTSTYILAFVLVTSHREVLVIPQVLIIFTLIQGIGGMIFIAGFIGCLGHVRIHRTTLKTFLVVGIIVFLMVFALALYLPTRESTSIFVENQHWSSLDSDTIDVIQSKYKCCGYYGPADFKTTPMRLSCFHTNVNGPLLMLTSHHKGCLSQMEGVFFVLWVKCLILAGGGLVVLVVGLVGTVGLENHLRRQKKIEENKFKVAERAMKNIALKRAKKHRVSPVQN